jgi:hypothetical protein
LEKYFFDLNQFLEERVIGVSEQSFEVLEMVYSVRKALFNALGRKGDYAVY